MKRKSTCNLQIPSRVLKNQIASLLSCLECILGVIQIIRDIFILFILYTHYFNVTLVCVCQWKNGT
jgi:hypothetical protein